ncbi:MAG: NAD(P)H-hydrate epimerase, partial [Candidatus Krumholzibacteria bacterium]|nr:NAD(P)H-hydrate epimerase [Candidatus Krumholzibacteria bacterium]
MKIVTARQMAALDTETIERHGIPGLDLMERAGTGIFNEVITALDRLEPRRFEQIEQAGPARGEGRAVVLFAGKGNNGGDAFVVARLLHSEGIKTLTILVGATAADLKGDALANHRRLQELSAEISEVHEPEGLEALRERCEAAGLVVDALLGTGLSGKPKGLAADAIRFINTLDPPVVAVDIPSGISGDSGAQSDHGGVADCFVHADLTVTMALPKL